MQIKLSENIKRFRKERQMTQEQLAEAMGVSVSAVHKWESAQSTPEIGLILEMADLFRTSTDVLLGYEWKTDSAAMALERIARLTKAKKYAEAVMEAEKALKNHPNCFDIVYQSAFVYLQAGAEVDVRKARRRAIALLEHACELIAQNQDEDVSEVTIRTQIAKAQLALGEPQTALRILKRYNVCGVNDALIGMVLGDFLHDADGAKEYLGRAFSSFAQAIDNIMIGFANVFFQYKEYDTAIECLEWLRIVLRGTQPEDTLTWSDGYDCILLETICECACLKGDLAAARQALQKAIEKARRFDAAAKGEIADMAFFTKLGLAHQPTWSNYTTGTMQALQKRVETESAAVPHLAQLYAEMTKEAPPFESV